MSWSARRAIECCGVAFGLVWQFGLPPPAAAESLGCTLDAELSQAAASLLLSRAVLEAAQLDAAVREAGSDAVFLHARFGAASDAAATKRWLDEQRARADAPLICGQADSEAGRLLIASARGGSLAPIDLGARVVRGELARGFGRAELVIAAADGSLQRLAASSTALARGIPLDLALPTPIEVQLVAHGPSGPRPVAERTLAASGATPSGAVSAPSGTTAPPGRSAGAVAGPDPLVGSGDDLGRLLEELRQTRGRSRLRGNRLLREVAQTHAETVCREGRLAHEVGHGGDPEARLARAGLSARLVGEAIARAPDAAEAFASLQRSPSHLLTVLEPRFTDIGLGQARDAQGKTCFVVLLAAWPRHLAR